NQGGSFAAPVAKCPSTRGKGIIADDAATPFVGGVVGNYEFTREEWDASYRPTFRVLTKKVFKDLAVFKTMVDQFLTPREMAQVESLSDDQLTTKMSMLHCMMMSHGGELLARYHGLNRSHHKYVLSADSMLKGYEEKKMAHFVPGAQGRLAEASPLHEKLVRPANVPTSRDAYVSPSIAKDSNVTPTSESLKLSANVILAPSVVASEQNEEWVNAMVYGPDVEMTDRSEHVSSGLIDVVVALSAGEKGDGSLPSLAADEEATANPSRV
nr:hypothetical protein [Tanacetum cinerariifolium]